ncbi:MAG: ATP-binding cassette domain-containing protein, partial [Bacteroidota bacterium]
PDSGYVTIGDTVSIGYFDQEVRTLKEQLTVIGNLREIAEYIDTGLGKDRYITAKELLDRFQFPAKQHHSFVHTLSGGEKRRLAMLMALMSNPNVLMFDEPTNDFDIATLTALEEYVEHFKGVLLIVSHDRSFLDRTVETIYAFEGENIKEYPGNYSAYLEN